MVNVRDIYTRQAIIEGGSSRCLQAAIIVELRELEQLPLMSRGQKCGEE